MFTWLKKHCFFICFTIIMSITLFPVIIHVLFKIHTNNQFLVAEWSAGDMLSYYGSCLSFIGTISLGLLSMYQNKIIQEEADKRVKFIEEMNFKANMPKFYVKINGSRGIMCNLDLYIKNISENPATNISLYEINFYNKDGKLISVGESSTYDKFSPDCEECINLKNKEIRDDYFTLTIKMSCDDKYGNKHFYIIEGDYNHANNTHFPIIKIREIQKS